MKYTRLALALVIMALIALAVIYALERTGRSIVNEQKHEAENAPPAPEFTVMNLAPDLKLKMRVPKGWGARVAPGGGSTLELFSLEPRDGNSPVATLDFTPGEPESAKQGEVDNLLRLLHAGYIKSGPDGRVHVVEMSSTSGMGAYTVVTLDMNFFGGREPAFIQTADGLFLTHGVLVRFGTMGIEQLPRVVSFIEKELTVENASAGAAQKLALGLSPNEKMSLQAPPGWTLFSLRVGGCWELVLQSPGGMRVTLFAALQGGVKFVPSATGPEDAVSAWVKLLPAGEQTPPVELKSPSGRGSYATHAFTVADGSKRNEVRGLFEIGDAFVWFSSDNVGDVKSEEFQQALKFITEGMAVEAVK